MSSEHPLVGKTRRALQQLDKQIAVYRQDVIDRQERASRGEPVVQLIWDYPRDFIRNGGIIRPGRGVADVAVSTAARERALKLLDTLIRLLGKQRIQVRVEGKATVVARAGRVLGLQISEQAARSPIWPQYAPKGWAATGRLKVSVANSYGGFHLVKDTEEAQVEELLPSLVEKIDATLADAEQREINAEKTRATRAEKVAATKGVESERLRSEAEGQRTRAVDDAFLEDLYREAAAWREAVDIRAYVESVVISAGDGGADHAALTAWAEWARAVADGLNPVTRRLQQLGLDMALSARAVGMVRGLQVSKAVSRAPGPKAIKIKQVVEKVSLSQSTIYALIAKGNFPKPFDLMPGRVAWLEEDINAWLTAQTALRSP
ncbi:helix-turn-helix transcriptional regulator [Cupriavidus sp. H18C2]|uniref:helix-turn-helix transcriptional regulator n=1 Tax=Cupriavidus sp. H18C2 TaxID=3241602 RepID=UPI003BF7FCF5